MPDYFHNQLHSSLLPSNLCPEVPKRLSCDIPKLLISQTSIFESCCRVKHIVKTTLCRSPAISCPRCHDQRRSTGFSRSTRDLLRFRAFCEHAPATIFLCICSSRDRERCSVPTRPNAVCTFRSLLPPHKHQFRSADTNPGTRRRTTSSRCSSTSC